ncbi:UNVERIFIED_CONTAM: hypothetical protein C3P02_19395, partial [Clostridioides difficile]
MKLPDDTFGFTILEFTTFFKLLPKNTELGTEVAELEPFKLNGAWLTTPTEAAEAAIRTLGVKVLADEAR